VRHNGTVAETRTLSDFYEELGVARDATRDDVVLAFRRRAKALHPDARPDDAEAAERFKRLGTAYGVLVDPVQRARYDATLRAGTTATGGALGAGRAAPSPRVAATPRDSRRLTRRGARWAVGGGAALVLLGLLAGAFVVSLQRHDGDLRARGVATVATVVDAHGERRLQFVTRSGRTVQAVESVKSGEEQPPVGARVPIHYDRTDPTNIVTDDGHTGRDITLWIVAVKFLLGGLVLIWFGRRRLRVPA
jgi:DnaJ domain/Protein of unknown function (DUF3592)